MTALFWISLLCVVYAYVGYGVVLRIIPGVQATKGPQQFEATVSIILAAHNEEKALAAKLDNLRRLVYPRHLVHIVVVSDGSSDHTPDILDAERSETLTSIILPDPVGKASALNKAVEKAKGDILVFFDVRQSVDLDALAHLVSPFADMSVGAVSGELLLETSSGEPSGEALGIYWRIEKAVRKRESATGSVVGTTGAIYAIRRALYTPMPAGTILDDVFIPMHVAKAGYRVVFQPAAIARDRLFQQKGKEFSRKVRTLTGNYQLIRLAPWLLSFRNPLLFRFVSHKLFRLIVPLCLVTMLMSSFTFHGYYRGVFIAQIVLYTLSLLGTVSPGSRNLKPIAIATTFVMLNVAAACAFYNGVTGRTTRWS